MKKDVHFYTANNSVVEFINTGYSMTAVTQIHKRSLEFRYIYVAKQLLNMRAWWQMLNTKGRIHLNLPSCANIAGLAVGKRIQKISCLVYKGRIRIASNSLVTASN